LVNILDIWEFFSPDPDLSVKPIFFSKKGNKSHVRYLKKKPRNLNLWMNDQLYLFDKSIIPISLYGREVWCFGDTLEKVRARKILQTFVELETKHGENNGTLSPRGSSHPSS
jgi:hypothetical protein